MDHIIRFYWHNACSWGWGSGGDSASSNIAMTVTCVSCNTNLRPIISTVNISDSSIRLNNSLCFIFISRDRNTSIGDTHPWRNPIAPARIPACVIVRAIHLMTLCSSGKQIRHSATMSKMIFAAFKVPHEYVEIEMEFGMIYPSIEHRPSSWFASSFASSCFTSTCCLIL